MVPEAPGAPELPELGPPVPPPAVVMTLSGANERRRADGPVDAEAHAAGAVLAQQNDRAAPASPAVSGARRLAGHVSRPTGAPIDSTDGEVGPKQIAPPARTNWRRLA